MARVPRGRGGRVSGRGGRSGGRGGRSGGRGLVSASFEWETQSESSEQVVSSSAYPEGSEGPIGLSDSSGGAGFGVGAKGATGDPGAGESSGRAQDREDQVSKLLALILERLPGAVPERMLGEARREQYFTWSKELLLLGPLPFWGSGWGGPEGANEWRLRMERRLRHLRCPDEFCVELAVEYLEGNARLWWAGVQARRRRTMWAWGDFLAEFNAKYCPPGFVEQLERQFQDLVQGGRSVREYDAEFRRLVVYASGGMDEERAQMGKFVSGLRIGLRKRGMVYKYASRAELVEALVVAEGLAEQFEE